VTHLVGKVTTSVEGYWFQKRRAVPMAVPAWPWFGAMQEGDNDCSIPLSTFLRKKCGAQASKICP